MVYILHRSTLSRLPEKQNKNKMTETQTLCVLDIIGNEIAFEQTG